MASPEFQVIVESVAQMRDFPARIAQQQQTAMEAMLNSERSRPAAQVQGINEKYLRLAFQLKSAT